MDGEENKETKVSRDRGTSEKGRSLVLIVDDVPRNLQVLGSILRTEEDCQIAVATSGRQALSQAKDVRPDLILLDIMMPEMDGYEVCKRLRKDPETREIPVIFLTAKTDTESKVRGLEIGGQDYVTKPFNSAELLARVRTHLKLKKSRDIILGMNKKLEETDQMKNEFISILAHDLGTPIAVMKGNIELMKKGVFGEVNEKQSKKLESMLRSAIRLDKLRKDTLVLSRMDVGSMTLELEAVKLKDLIEGAVEDMRRLADDKDQEISMDMPELEEVRCDPGRIRQVMDNYLSNAVRYTGEGGRISIGARRIGSETTVWVKDNGRGLPSEELEKVFERFYRTGERVEGSTGLGLAIVKGIIEAHGGRAWCESEGEGKGSTFFFTLPAK